MKTLIHVQHLLGVGHLQRAAALANALLRDAFEVTLVSGGRPCPLALDTGVGFYQLPPMFSPDGSFEQLLDDRGQPVDDAWRERRAAELQHIYAREAPQILITEGFPFARRTLRFELVPLLTRARSDPGCRLIVASVRDILQPKTNPQRNRETLDWIERFYDRILVHGDERLAGLEYSFAPASQIRERIGYSGYIFTGREDAIDASGYGDVVVSAGGSDTGRRILETALAARGHGALADRHWRLLVSPAIDQRAFRELQARADAAVTIERNRPDFPVLLERACLSVSQAGYNTVTDLLRTRTPAVLIPYAEADELEQTLRAELLQKRGRAIVVHEAELTAARLAAAIERATRLDTRLDVDLDGARHSVALIREWLGAQREAS